MKFFESPDLVARQRLSDWLLVSLASLYEQIASKESASISYGTTRIPFRGDHSDLIVGIYYRAIPDEDRLLFRQALGDALLAASGRGLRVEAVVDMLVAVARVKAVEAVHVLPAFVLTRSWNGTVVDRDGRTVVQHVMAVLGSLVPEIPVAEVTRAILDDAGFDQAFLLWGVTVLAQCEPERAPEMLGHYIDRISDRRQLAIQNNHDREASEAVAEWLADTLKVVGDSWAHAALELAGGWSTRHRWLADALVPLLRLQLAKRTTAAEDPKIVGVHHDHVINIEVASGPVYSAVARSQIQTQHPEWSDPIARSGLYEAAYD